MSYRCDILLSGSMGNIADVARRSLENHGLKVQSMPFPQNSLRDECGYLRELKKALDKYKPHVIIPIGDVTVLSRFRTYSTSIVPVADANVIELLNSKTECCRLASDVGLPQPLFFNDIDQIDLYPVIFKRDRSFGGTGVRKPSTRQALEQLVSKEKSGSRWLVQEFIEGENYSIDVFMHQDKFEYGCYHSISSKQGMGPSASREIISKQSALSIQLAEYARLLLEPIGFQGVCGLDFIVGNNGRPFFLECNPRFTGGLQTQIDSGLDLPFLWYNMAIDSENKQ